MQTDRRLSIGIFITVLLFWLFPNAVYAFHRQFPVESSPPQQAEAVCIFNAPDADIGKCFVPGRGYSGRNSKTVLNPASHWLLTYYELRRNKARPENVLLVEHVERTEIPNACGVGIADVKNGNEYINEMFRIVSGSKGDLCRMDNYSRPVGGQKFIARQRDGASKKNGLADQYDGGNCTYYDERKREDGSSYLRCHPPYERRLIATLFLAFGGLFVSLLGVHYVDEERTIFRPALIVSGLIAVVLGLLLWWSSFMFWSWNWIV